MHSQEGVLKVISPLPHSCYYCATIMSRILESPRFLTEVIYLPVLFTPLFLSSPFFFSLSYDVTKSKKDCLLLQSYQRRKISRNTLSQILYPETLVLKHLFLVQDSSLLLQVQDIFTKGYNQKTAQSTERILKVLNLLVK